MKINSSICVDCKHFWHECAIGYDNDGSCEEYCSHENAEIRDNFFKEDDIKECKGYESK